MSLPTILSSAYLLLGLLFSLFVVISDKKRNSGLGPSAGLPDIDPYSFWLYWLLWPVAVLLWLINDAARKRREAHRETNALKQKEKNP